MIYFGVYCWKYVYDPLWYIIKVGKYIDSMVEIFAYVLMFAHRPQSCESLDRAWDTAIGVPLGSCQ